MRASVRTTVCLLALVAAGCEFMPGSKAYQVAQAKRRVAELLLDPASAEFRNVSVRGEYLCGELNGRNRMGAFVGFSRFVVRLDGNEPLIEPEFDYSDLFSAEESCRSLAGNEYASYSTQLAACERAVEKRAEADLQARFDERWQKHCSLGTRSAMYRPPLGDVATPSDPGNANFTSSSTDESEASEEDRHGEDYSEPSTTPVVDENGNPVGPPPDSEAVDQSSQRPDSGLSQQWLDNVLGGARQPQRPPVQEAPPATPQPPD